MEPERSGADRSSDDGRDDGETAARDGDGEATSGTPGAASISVDELFELLSRPGNRYILTYLVRNDGTVPYADLVEYVVDQGGTPAGLTTGEFRNRIAARLAHSNLPKLDDAGLVDYDPTAKTVDATETTEIAVPYLEIAMKQPLRD